MIRFFRAPGFGIRHVITTQSASPGSQAHLLNASMRTPAPAVSFLASDEASYIPGIELFVDGGVAKSKPAAF